MPFLLPRSLTQAERSAFVLAFGPLSALEVSTVLHGAISEAELTTPRVLVARTGVNAASLVQRLAGIHKFAPVMAASSDGKSDIASMVSRIALEIDEPANISVSSYGVEDDDYEPLVREILDAFRDGGFTRVNLLRPDQNELRAEKVASRRSLDIIAFPRGGGISLGPTAYVPDAESLRRRGTARPAPHSEIALSPRLARALVNLAGLSAGETLLDPFCGSGTIAVEALLMALRPVCVDTNRALLGEAKTNLAWAAREAMRSSFKIKAGDARELPAVLGERRVDAVVTEPILLPRLKSRPSTTAAKELVDKAGSVYSDALASMARVVRPGGRIVVVAPVIRTSEGQEVALGLDGSPLGLKYFQPGGGQVRYPVRVAFESTRWVGRIVYVFESRN
ncbi:MAG TPA: methyltransferase domain-containing protein [Nitrososphaerales archaeon]|nr:methyltransferase domain-containing protein [Nitrososphaerales archaeon]